MKENNLIRRCTKIYSFKIGNISTRSVRDQLGPQQLKYITFLKDSSDCFSFSLFTLLDIAEEDWAESLLAW